VRGGSPEQQAVLKRKPESKQSAKSPAGTVTDTSTGLMWQKKPDGKQRGWSKAKNYCNYLSLAGHLDWRLPSQAEMQGVMDREIEFDPYKKDDWYWTSSVYYANQKYALMVNFGTGHSRSFKKRLKLFPTRCVRGEN